MTCCTYPDCETILNRRNVSGLCRVHALKLSLLPESKANRIEGYKRWVVENRDAKREQATRASRSRMAWCPPEYRDEYRHLTRVKCLSAGAARAAILELVDAHAKRYRRTGQLQQAA